MASQLSKPGTALFEQIKKVDESGHKFWTARDMAKAQEYSEYRHLLPVIEKVKEACKNYGQKVEVHFEQMLEMVGIGAGAERSIENIKFSRYTYYLLRIYKNHISLFFLCVYLSLENCYLSFTRRYKAVKTSSNFERSSCDNFLMTNWWSRVNTLCSRKKLFKGRGGLSAAGSNTMLKPSLLDWLVICISKTSPVALMASFDNTNAGLRLVSVPLEDGKSIVTKSPCFTFMGYFNGSSHRASSLLSHSFAREVSWMEASTITLFFAAARGLTFTNLFACKNLRNTLLSWLRSLMVRMYSAIIQQSWFIDARSNLHYPNEKSKMILNFTV